MDANEHEMDAQYYSSGGSVREFLNEVAKNKLDVAIQPMTPQKVYLRHQPS